MFPTLSSARAPLSERSNADPRDASRGSKPFADLDDTRSTIELRRAGDGGAFVETPAALRRRVEALDAFGGARRTEEAVDGSGTETPATEEFDRRRAVTPYGGGFGREFAVREVREMRREEARDASACGGGGAVMEVLLWRDAARSAIHFAFGMSTLLAARLVPRSTVSGVSLVAYAAMVYLAYKYVWSVMFPRLSYGVELDERAVGDAARRVAVAFNAWALKNRGVLAGTDNRAVFQSFVALYAVSSLGHLMSAWAVATTLWVGAFTVPPLFEAYRYTLTNVYVNTYVLVSTWFDSLSAPKRWIGGLLLGGATFRVVNLKARLSLSFLALVAMRMFRETHVNELAAFENIVRSASRRVSRGMSEFAMVLSPVVRHRR